MHPSEKLEDIRHSIVRIETAWTNDSGNDVSGHGTGVVVGRLQKRGNLMVATAKHVIEEIPTDRDVDSAAG